jgi:Tfp pilus assembly protein PilE
MTHPLVLWFLAPRPKPKGEQMKKNIRNQKGQALMEYVIVSGLIGIMSLVAVKQFGTVIQKRIQSMKSQIVENIEVK